MANITQNSISKAKKVSKRIAKNSYNGVELPTNMAERRRLRNKLSAKIHRERKKDALEGVRREVFECDEELTKLKSELTVTRSKAIALQGIIDSIEDKFGADAVKNIFKQFDFDFPTTFLETYPFLVSSDSDDTITSDDDSLGCSLNTIVGAL